MTVTAINHVRNGNGDGDVPLTLAAALAAFQARIPTIRKDQVGVVKSDKGNYKYAYADLSDITEVAMPLLASVGLSWSCKPTMIRDEHGPRFALVYALRHVNGEVDAGEWGLPDPVQTPPQKMGGLISYSRRYAFCAVTGIAPGGDDDDAQASSRREQPAPDAPDWNGEFQRMQRARDAEGLKELWRKLNHANPNARSLLERIAAAVKQIESAQDGAQRPQGRPAATETPAQPDEAASGAASGPDGPVPDESPAREAETAPQAEAGAAGDFQMPVPPPGADQAPPAQQAHHRAIMKVLGDVQGWGRVGDDGRHAFFAGMLRRDIPSQTKVTTPEAAWILQTLARAKKDGQLGVLVYAAMGRELPTDPHEGLPDPRAEEEAWHEKSHPIWRLAQLDTEPRAEDCSVCAARTRR